MNEATLTITHDENSFTITGTSYRIGLFRKWATQYNYGKLCDGSIHCPYREQYDQCRRHAKHLKHYTSDC